MSGGAGPLDDAGRFGDVRRFDTLDSTNAYLLREAGAGAAEGTVAVADYQTAGRGRLGRSWEAPPGTSLLLSILLRPALPAGELTLCTAAVALGAADACATVSGIAPGIKWPNDLVVGDRKLGGVLAESDPDARGGAPGCVTVVVGVGINVDWPGPEGTGATSLRQAAGRPVHREALLAALLEELIPRRASLASDEGRARLAAELRDRCVTIGTQVRVELASGSLVGRAIGLGASGQLLVDTGTAVRMVTAGDVVHTRAEPPA